MNTKSKVTPVEACLAAAGLFSIFAVFLTWLTPTITIMGISVPDGSGHDGVTSGFAIFFANVFMLYLFCRSALATSGVVGHMSHWRLYTVATIAAFLLMLIGVGSTSNADGGPGLILGLVATVAAFVLCLLAALNKGVGRRPVVGAVPASDTKTAS